MSKPLKIVLSIVITAGVIGGVFVAPGAVISISLFCVACFAMYTIIDSFTN